MFSYVSLEERVPQHHSLRAMQKLVDQVLKGMSKLDVAALVLVGLL